MTKNNSNVITSYSIHYTKLYDPTIFSSMFLHAGLFHLGGNMLYLWIFGDNIEDRMGHVPFVVFYVLCGVAAALVV